MKSEIVSAAGLLSTREVWWPSKPRRTRHLSDTNGFPKHTLGVLSVFPRGVCLFTYPEHLGEEKGPLKEEENCDPCSCDLIQLWSHEIFYTLAE